MRNQFVAVVAIAMLLIGFAGAYFSRPTETSTYTTLSTTTYSTTVTSSQGSGFELNCVVTFHGDNPNETTTTVSGETVTTLLASSYTSLLKDYTTTTSVSSEAGEAVSTTALLTSAQSFPQWNETVCTWLPG